MKLLKLIRRLPFINEKIKILKPTIKDVLLEFYGKSDEMLFIDVGANTGQTIDFINNTFMKAIIYSFEPTPELFKELKKKYDRFDNVHIHDIALSDKDEQLDFFVSNYSPTNSCLEPNVELYEKFQSSISNDLKKSNKIKVKGMKLDSWYNNNIKGKIIDIIKIDTQGYEYNIIKGGINTLKYKTKLLYFEIQYLDFYKNIVPFYKIFEILYENGFYFFCYLDSNKINKYQILESNVLFLNHNYIKPYEL